VSVDLLCEIRYQTREHVQFDDIRRDRKGWHYLVKAQANGDTQLETGKLGLLSLKGLSAPVVTPELANTKMGVIAKVDAPISSIQVNSFSSLTQTPASKFD
jgi:hypothetical protein